MDRRSNIVDLLGDLDDLAITKIHDFLNVVDKAVHGASRSHIAIWGRYASANTRLNEDSVVEIRGLETGSYF